MATGSAAAARARRDEAGYWTGASSANQPRCGNCTHVKPHPGLFGKSKYDRLCALHDAAVKTHGCCKRHEKETK